MTALATTRAALIRGGVTEDALGDEIENNATPLVEWSDFPVSIIERDVNEFDDASNTWRTVRRHRARVPGNLPVEYGDRIRDNRDGIVYAIDSIRRAPRSLAGRAYATLMLRRSAP